MCIDAVQFSLHCLLLLLLQLILIHFAHLLSKKKKKRKKRETKDRTNLKLLYLLRLALQKYSKKKKNFLCLQHIQKQSESEEVNRSIVKTLS